MLSKLGIGGTSGATKTLSRKDRWSQALNPSAQNTEANILEPKATHKTNPWYSRLLGGVESAGAGLENAIAHGKGLKDLDYNDIKNFGAEAGRVFNKASQRAAEIATLSKPGELSTSINPVTLKEEKAQEPKTKAGNIFSELLGTLGYVAPTPGGLGTLMGRGEEAAAAIGKKVPQKLLSLIESKTPQIAQKYGGKALKGAATGAGVFAQEQAFRPEGAKPGLKALPEEMAGFAGAEVGGEALDALIKRLLGKSAPEIKEILSEARPTVTQPSKTIGRGALVEPKQASVLPETKPISEGLIPSREGATQKAPERTSTPSMNPTIEQPKPPEAATELLGENVLQKPNAKEILQGKIKGNVINVNDKQYEISGESLKKYKAAKKSYDDAVKRLNSYKAVGEQSAIFGQERKVKGLGMQLTALKRDLTGEYTPRELTKLLEREGTNYIGKDVLAEVNGQNVPAKITSKPAFGSIEVELQGGERIRLKADKLTDPRANEDILKQIKAKPEAKPYIQETQPALPTAAEEPITVGQKGIDKEFTIPQEPTAKEILRQKIEAKKGKVGVTEELPKVEEIPTKPEIPEVELRPVEVGGETKTRGLSKGVEEKAIENKLTKSLGDLPEYTTVNMKEQAYYATEILNNEPDKAIRIAKGQEPAPSHVLPEAIFTAVENKALREGNIDLIKELAHSGLTEEATVMGQRIRALAERDPDSAVSNIKEVLDSRKKAVERKTGKSIDESFNEITKDIRKEIKAPKKQDWSDFIDSLRC